MWIRFLAFAALIGIPVMAAVARKWVLTRIDLTDQPIDLPYPDADPIRLQLDVPLGEIDLAPGGEALVQGTISYNVEEWEPLWLIKEGKMRLYQGERFIGLPPIDARNEWDLKLGTAAPYSLRVNTGASRADLNLSGLPLTDLEVNAGAGEMELRFDAANPERMKRLKVNTGAGAITLSGLLNANCERLHLTGGAGQLEARFEGGPLTASGTAKINAGVGETVIVVAKDVPARIVPTTGLGGVSASREFHRDGKGYETPGYGDAEAHLDIKVDVGVGSVRLEMW